MNWKDKILQFFCSHDDCRLEKHYREFRDGSGNWVEVIQELYCKRCNKLVNTKKEIWRQQGQSQIEHLKRKGFKKVIKEVI